jgi:hypothetical protein
MEVRLRLEWFDKVEQYLKGDELSADLENDGSIIDKLGLPFDETIYDGVFDVKNDWIKHIQPYFKHKIDTYLYNYQLAFRCID